MEIIKIDSFDELRQYVKEVTQKERDRVSALEKKTDQGDGSPLEREISNIFSSADFGCQTKAVGLILSKLVSEITGTKAVIEKKDPDGFGFEPFRFLAVFLENDNTGHGGETGRAALVLKNREGETSDYFWAVDYDLHETDGIEPEDKARLATDSEIDALFENWEQNTSIHALLGNLV